MNKKIILMSLVVLILSWVGGASAQMVDIGTGQMPATEFKALKAVMAGKAVETGSVTSPRKVLEQYGPVQMTPAEFQTLRDQLGADLTRSTRVDAPMVDIGTGEMPRDEFIALKRLIKERKATVFGNLAILLP